MARGKHGQAAAVRHEVQSRDAEIEAYKRNVARLTQENRQLRNQLGGEQQRHRDVERRLRAEREKGVSPQVEALRLQVATLGEQVNGLKAAAERYEKRAVKMSRKLVGHLVNDDNWTFDDAIRFVGPIIEEETGRGVAGVVEHRAMADGRDAESVELARKIDHAREARRDKSLRVNSTPR